MGGKTKIKNMGANRDINIKNRYALAVFKKLGINPSTNCLMDVKKAIFKLYNLDDPEMTVIESQKTLSNQKPNNAYGIAITVNETKKFMQLFGLTENDWFQESVGGRIVNDIMGKKIDRKTISFIEITRSDDGDEKVNARCWKKTNNKKISNLIIWISIIFAFSGAALSFLTTQPKVVKFIGKTYSSHVSTEGINHITQTPNPYRTTSKERWVGPLRYFYLKDSEPGFNYIKNTLQTVYYKELNHDILLFAQWQAAHIFDPMAPGCTIRPIFAIPKNNETAELNFEKDYAAMMRHAYYVSDEKMLTLALDNYHKTNLLFFATLLIVISILINGVSQLKNKKSG